jgi:hypothetical protein
MSVRQAPPTRAEFTPWVHDALSRLYDLPHPQVHRLADLFADEGASALQRTQALRKLLLDAIRGLRPRCRGSRAVAGMARLPNP